MKKIYLLFLLFFFSANTSFSQSLIPVNYGIKAGVNLATNSFSTIEGISPPSTSYQIGIQGGFFMQIALDDKWYITPEVLYSQEGVGVSYEYRVPLGGDMLSYNVDGTIILTHIRINPHINFKATDVFSLNFGPSVGYLIGSEIDFQTTTADESSLTPTTGELPDANSIDIGLNIGLTYYFNNHLFFNPRVYTGFMSVETDSEDWFDTKNQGFIFSLGYIF